jgi:hypothetical protein
VGKCTRKERVSSTVGRFVISSPSGWRGPPLVDGAPGCAAGLLGSPAPWKTLVRACAENQACWDAAISLIVCGCSDLLICDLPDLERDVSLDLSNVFYSSY